MVNVRYRIENVLGSGGSGAVCKAFDLVEKRHVAMKRLATEKFATSKELARAQSLLEREYYVLSELAHPKIIEVYDYGVDDHGAYYTMEWLQGQNLRQLAPLSVAAACTLIRDVASSLAILHSRRLVHRDVTPHNIHCTEIGNAKLIDFGAMTPFGVPKLVVGTPPFMAPECLDYQLVDGRTDLFSLGACLYYALTGRHAYAARSIKELPDLWRYPIVWASRFAQAVPESLDRLILELLSLKPAGRPGSAAEVFERLTTIASLDSGEPPDVARAYVVSPALAGRREQLAPILRRTLRAARGKGASVVITGASGVGRSRLLSAAMLEAKVAGFTVLQADAPTFAPTPFAAVRSMARALADVAPDAAEALATAGTYEGPITPASRTQRDADIERLALMVRDVCRTRSVALAVDDVHLADAESLAVLALLSTSLDGMRLLVLTTLDSNERRSSDVALALLLSSSTRVELQPFTAAETRDLLSSLFGEVPNLDILGGVAQACTNGNARELLEGVEELVDRGLVAYAGGGWTIANDPEALGRALTQGTDVARRFEGLTREARRLGSVLALDRDATLSLVDYPGVAFAGDRPLANQALTVLLESGLITLVHDRCRFSRESDRAFIAAALLPEERRAIHLRLAEHTRRVANPIYPAYHYFLAGDAERAAAAQNDFRDFVDVQPNDSIVRQPIVLDTVELIVTSDASFSRPFRAEHGAGLVINAVYQGLPERAAPHVARFLRELSWLTALDDYHAHPEMEPSERLGMAFALSQSRCEGTPGINPISALRRLCQLGRLTTVCARFMADPSLLRAIPDLSPFAPLSPAVGLAIRLIDASSLVVRGRQGEGREAISRIYADLRGPAAEGVDPLTQLALEGTALGQLCSVEADYGVEGALAHIDELSTRMPNLAESCRARYYLSRGLTQESEAARRDCERLSVQSGGLLETRISELTSYLALYSLLGDVLGLKRTLAAMMEVLKTRPAWKARVALARAQVLRCRHEYAAGLATIDAALSELAPENGEWSPAAALRVTLLDLSGDMVGAVRSGTHDLAVAIREGLPHAGIALALALSCARAGEGALAERHLATAREALESQQASGIHLGVYFEVGARIASLTGDRDEFAARAEHCAQFFRHGENPVLTARYDALLRNDRVVQAQTSPSVDQAATVIIRARGAPGPSSAAAPESSFTSDALADALGLLVERTNALGGFLYVRGAAGWNRVYGTPGLAVPADLDAAVHGHLTELEEPATAVMGPQDGATESHARPLALSIGGGEHMISCPLTQQRETDRIVAVAVLSVEGDASVDIPTTSLVAAARALSPHVSLAL